MYQLPSATIQITRIENGYTVVFSMPEIIYNENMNFPIADDGIKHAARIMRNEMQKDELLSSLNVYDEPKKIKKSMFNDKQKNIFCFLNLFDALEFIKKKYADESNKSL